jgi:hypothetical protein
MCYHFFIIKPIRCTNITNLFCHETLHVSDSSSVHHQEFIHCTLSNGTCHTAFEQDQDGTAVPPWFCSKAVYKPVGCFAPTELLTLNVIYEVRVYLYNVIIILKYQTNNLNTDIRYCYYNRHSKINVTVIMWK